MIAHREKGGEKMRKLMVSLVVAMCCVVLLCTVPTARAWVDELDYHSGDMWGADNCAYCWYAGGLYWGSDTDYRYVAASTIVVDAYWTCLYALGCIKITDVSGRSGEGCVSPLPGQRGQGTGFLWDTESGNMYWWLVTYSVFLHWGTSQDAYSYSH